MSRIRVGLLLDDMAVSAWAAAMLKRLARENGTEIVLVVRNAAVRSRSRPGLRPQGLRLMHGLWRKLDATLFRRQHDAFEPVDVSTWLAGIPCIDAETCEGEFRLTDLERIASCRVDVLLKLGFKTLRGAILRLPACGVWCVRYADRHGGRMPANGAKEVLSGEMASRSVLTILAEKPEADIVLHSSWSATDSISPSRGMNAAYWKAASFIPRKLRELDRLGRPVFMDHHIHRAERLAREDAEPGNAMVLMRLPLLFAGKLAEKVRGRRRWHQWMLLYRFEKKERPAEDWKKEDFAQFRELVPPDDRFWADPFVVEHDGRYAVFIEELEYADNIGYLSVINFDCNDDPVLPPVPILKKPYHLSYPHVFEDGGELYMVPETCQNGTIELYRAVRFPDKWEFVMNLMEEIRAVDTTIWKHGGKYWMFSNVAENKGASTCDELFLFYSDDLLSSRWHSHPGNPIVSDVRRARPAGRIFERDGCWYRPSQDCSGNYGRAIEIQRIERIDETTYIETPAGRIDPGWDRDIICTHTLNGEERLTCIDGLKVRQRMPPLRQAFVRRWHARFGKNKRPGRLSAFHHAG